MFERDVVEQENLLVMQHNSTVFLSLVTLAIITSVSGFGIIKELGSVANKVLVMLRNALLIYPATQLYDEVVAPIQVIGYSVTLLGTAGSRFQGEPGGDNAHAVADGPGVDGGTEQQR